MKLDKQLFLAVLIAGIMAGQGFAAEPKTADALAVVSGEAIMQPEFDSAWAGILTQAKQLLTPEQMTPQWEKTQKAMLLNQLVEQRLLAQAAKKKGVEAAKKDVAAALRKVKSQFKTPEAFQKELAKENITEKQFSDRIENQLRIAAFTNGLIKERVKAPTAEQIRKLFDSVKERLAQPDKVDAAGDAQQAEITALARYFKTNLAERVKIQYILFKADEKAAPEQLAANAKKADEVKAKLDAGASFTDMAMQYSEDKATAPKGGEIGYIVRGQMVKDYEDVIFGLPVGAVSGVVNTKPGYQIIRVMEKTAAAEFRYEGAREYLANYLVRVAAKEEVARYVQDLKKSAVISVRPEPVKL